MKKFKKPYLINIEFTILALLITLVASVKDLKMLVGSGFVIILLYLLYSQRLLLIKIFYVIQFVILLLGIVGISMIIEKFDTLILIGIYSIFVNMCIHVVLAYFTVIHQIAEVDSQQEKNQYKIVKILFSIFLILFLITVICFVMAEKNIDSNSNSNSSKNENAKDKLIGSSKEYFLYNCQNYINNVEKPIRVSMDKLTITKNNILLAISYQDIQDPSKKISDVNTQSEGCQIDYGSQFFVCKSTRQEKYLFVSDEMSFDGVKSFQWKILTTTTIGKDDFNSSNIMRCDVRKTN